MKLNPFYIKVVNVQLEVVLNTGITADQRDSLVVNKPSITEKATKVFDLLVNENPKFIIFPEYSFFATLEELFVNRSAALDCIIISGSYINSDHIPELKIFLPNGEVNVVQKHGLAPVEYQQFQNIQLQNGMLPNVFTVTIGGREVNFLVLICYDFYDSYYKFFETSLDLLFVTSYNRDNEKFFPQLNEFCFKNPSFCVYSNIAGNGLGESSIFGIHEKTAVHDKHLAQGIICAGRESFQNLIANSTPDIEQMIVAELDISRPYLIRPNAIALNNVPNVLNVRKFDL